MKILGIETSCDETAAAVVQDGKKVIASTVSSSEAIHKKYGGIVPEVAARKQAEYMIPVISEVMDGISLIEIDAIAVTEGPGLVGSLLIGVETAKSLAYAWNKPIIPVNHLIAHLYAPLAEGVEFEFPVLGLIVSGGHSELVLMNSHTDFKLLGETRDDAAGECFDKCARSIGLPYPGGPEIAELAGKFEGRSNLKFPRPLKENDTLDFSFSGLKSAFAREAKKNTNKKALAYELQEAIVEVLVEKTDAAFVKTGAKMIVVGGGVSANSRLREVFDEKFEKIAVFPSPSLSTDNAVVIATRAHYSDRKVSWRDISPNPALSFS